MVHRSEHCLHVDRVAELNDGTPNRHTMLCQKNFWDVLEVIVDSALASIHSVKY
jgi:hypothetical protein